MVVFMFKGSNQELKSNLLHGVCLQHSLNVQTTLALVDGCRLRGCA